MTDWTEDYLEPQPNEYTVYPNPETGKVVIAPLETEPHITEEGLRQLEQRLAQLQADIDKGLAEQRKDPIVGLITEDRAKGYNIQPTSNDHSDTE